MFNQKASIIGYKGSVMKSIIFQHLTELANDEQKCMDYYLDKDYPIKKQMADYLIDIANRYDIPNIDINSILEMLGEYQWIIDEIEQMIMDSILNMKVEVK
jgi:hypothetical protein